jgi:translation initiation factor IF-3
MKEFRISDPRTNDRIRVPEVRLVGPNGEQVGVVSIDVALRLAQEADLDLVEVAPNSKPPVAKIMDYGKFKYEEAQKAKEARRNQANTILKEVRFRLKIDTHDYETKRKRAEGFLLGGDKVKAMILFRGREQSRPDQGVRLLQKFAEDVAEFGSVESTPTIDGRNMVMVIGPHKTKAAAKAEADARRSASKPERRTEEAAGDPDAIQKPASDKAAEKTAAQAASKAPLSAELVEDTFAKAVPKTAPAKSAAPRVPSSSASASSASAPSGSSSPASAPKTSAAAPSSAPSSAPKSTPPASTPKTAVAARPPIKPTAAGAASAAKVMAAKAAPKKPVSAETAAEKAPKKEDKDA